MELWKSIFCCSSVCTERVGGGCTEGMQHSTNRQTSSRRWFLPLPTLWFSVLISSLGFILVTVLYSLAPWSYCWYLRAEAPDLSILLKASPPQKGEGRLGHTWPQQGAAWFSFPQRRGGALRWESARTHSIQRGRLPEESRQELLSTLSSSALGSSGL